MKQVTKHMNERGQNGNMNREYGRKRYIITMTISDARSDQRDCFMPFWPLSFICFVTCFNCYPVIRKHVIQPYYDQRGESNPEFAYKNADPDEQLFEDRAAEETPVKTKESRKKGKTIS